MDGGSGGEDNEREQRDEELSFPSEDDGDVSCERYIMCPGGDSLLRRGGTEAPGSRMEGEEWRRGGNGGESATRRRV